MKNNRFSKKINNEENERKEQKTKLKINFLFQINISLLINISFIFKNKYYSLLYSFIIKRKMFYYSIILTITIIKLIF